MAVLKINLLKVFIWDFILCFAPAVLNNFVGFGFNSFL